MLFRSETTNIDKVGLLSGKMKLKEDEYFVLGDDRENSEDSRNPEVGNVKRAHIYGKAWFVISPYENFGFIKEERTCIFSGIRVI